MTPVVFSGPEVNGRFPQPSTPAMRVLALTSACLRLPAPDLPALSPGGGSRVGWAGQEEPPARTGFGSGGDGWGRQDGLMFRLRLRLKRSGRRRRGSCYGIFHMAAALVG